MRRDPAGPGSRGGNWRLDTVEDARDYVAGFPEVFGGIRVDGDLVVVAFTADLDEHLRGLQASVEHPELVRMEAASYSIAKLETDIREIRQRLKNDPRRPLGSSSPGRISLRAPFAAIAADLHHRYGDALDITVGSKPFPPERITESQAVGPLPISTAKIPNLKVELHFDTPAVVAGEDLRGSATITNGGQLRLRFITGLMTGGVRRPGDDKLAGVFVGAVTAVGLNVDLDPGQSGDIPVLIGTASCLPDRSYIVPAGVYEVVATLSVNRRDDQGNPTGHQRHVVIGPTIEVTSDGPPGD